MKKNFTLEYWIDDEWYVGRIKEIPGVFSQGETLKDLEENIQDAFRMLSEEDLQSEEHPNSKTKNIILEVA